MDNGSVASESDRQWVKVMDPIPTAEGRDGDALCTTCFKPIDPRAKKCTACDSYQDWRGYLSMSGSVLALLVALVSVFALATPLIQAAVAPKDSRLHFTFQGIARNQVYIMVSNSGTRPGSVTALTIYRGVPSTPLRFSLDPILIKPGEALQIIKPLPAAIRQAVDRSYVEAKLHDRSRASVVWAGNTGKRVSLKPDLKKIVVLRAYYADFAGTEREPWRHELDEESLFVGAGTPWHECVTTARLSNPSSKERDHMMIMFKLRSCGEFPRYLEDLFGAPV